VSQENVEILKASIAAWNAGDMDALRELHHPDAVVRSVEGWPEPGPYVGREAVLRQWQQQREAFDEDVLVPIGDFIDAGDRVVVRFVWRGAGRGPDTDLEMTQVVTMRKGKIFYREYFWDHAEALEAAGLEE
jgi:ketosteroid isomerase-like protein